MSFRLTIKLVVLLLVLLRASAAAAHAQAQPGCPSRCGDVEIPYPFGTRPGCFLNEGFLITCNDTFNPPKPFLRKSNIDVVNITTNGRMNVMQFVARDCYDRKGNSEASYATSISLSKFITVSNTENKFVVIGCDSYAHVSGFLGEDRYQSGCRSTCDSLEYVTNGSCVGIGCCQIEIPTGLKQLDVDAHSFNNHTNVSSFNPCTYAFVVDQSRFNFSSNYLNNITDEFPIVLDWEIITNKTCEEEKICGQNASCDKPDDNNNTSSGYHYHCKCNKGYKGNPYLRHGCQDVDECEDPSLHNCTHKCYNTAGNYTCRCRNGFHGDGRKDGGGCIPNRNHEGFHVALAVCVSFVAAIMIISWLHFLWKRRRHMKLKEKFFEQNGGRILQRELSKLQGRSSEKAKIFTEEEIKTVTNNYASVIGHGGSGLVYKGFLPNKTPVAVKKSKIVDHTKNDEFINELVVVSQINNRNVVRLLGCCLETQVPLLVYEFVGNGTLFAHIHEKDKGKATTNLSWEVRLKIAAETAGALSYLHSETNVPIIHRDVKSANILLGYLASNESPSFDLSWLA